MPTLASNCRYVIAHAQFGDCLKATTVSGLSLLFARELLLDHHPAVLVQRDQVERGLYQIDAHRGIVKR
jgi:hypothetical protein